MGPHLIVVVGFIYLYIAVESFCTGKIGISIVFAGYAFSNIGLWLGAR
jgi:hypothetical protein